MPFQKVKHWIFHLFHFNKQERNGIFILCLLLCALVLVKLLLPFLADRNNTVELMTLNLPANASTDSLEASVATEQQDHTEHSGNYSGSRFVFNPNTVSLKDLRSLGLSEKLATTCLRFRSKGGKFFKPEDFKKLYGLSPKLYAELEPYILIPHAGKQYHHTFKKDSVFSKPHYPERKAYPKAVVEINSADSVSIVFLKGIGPGFTKRIIKYRALLGGFHSVNQLKEIWGMTDSLFNILSSQIVLNSAAITKIPINAIDLNSLKKHPYFNFQSATAIINYRNKHGRLTEADIINLGVLNPDKLQLVLPYLQY